MFRMNYEEFEVLSQIFKFMLRFFSCLLFLIFHCI
uniref:Uncharacterized protein n=1 Tax=Arundo donax TaxID=35708 RepID=A0A0A9GU43_ARUDO